MATSPNLPPGPQRVDLRPAHERRRQRRYLAGVLIIAGLVILFLVLWFLRFANTGPARRNPGSHQQSPAGILLPVPGSMAA